MDILTCTLSLLLVEMPISIYIYTVVTVGHFGVYAVIVAGGAADVNTVIVAGGTGGGGHDGQSSDDGQGPRTGP